MTISHKIKWFVRYLPLVCRSSEDAVYSMDDGELDLLSFELVVYVLQSKARPGQLVPHHLRES